MDFQRDGSDFKIELVRMKVSHVGVVTSYGTYLPQGIYGAGLLFFFLQEQIKDIIIIIQVSC